MTELSLGLTGQATVQVCQENTAQSVGSGLLPVFATPMMIALIEQAASEAVAPFLSAGQSTVGTMIQVSHDAPSPIGATITATATVTAIDRRRIDFSVLAHDGQKQIGQGTHSRFIVDNAKFLAKVQ